MKKMMMMAVAVIGMVSTYAKDTVIENNTKFDVTVVPGNVRIGANQVTKMHFDDAEDYRFCLDDDVEFTVNESELSDVYNVISFKKNKLSLTKKRKIAKPVLTDLTAVRGKQRDTRYWNGTEDTGTWVGSEWVDTACDWHDMAFTGMVADGRKQVKTGKLGDVIEGKIPPEPSKDVLSRSVNYTHNFVAYVEEDSNIANIYEFDKGHVLLNSFCVYVK